MTAVNEFSAMVLVMLLGFFILHVFQGTGTNWVHSFFSASTSGVLQTGFPTSISAANVRAQIPGQTAGIL